MLKMKCFQNLYQDETKNKNKGKHLDPLKIIY